MVNYRHASGQIVSLEILNATTPHERLMHIYFCPPRRGAHAAGLCGSSSDLEELYAFGDGTCNYPCGGNINEMCGTCSPRVLRPALLAVAGCFHIDSLYP